MALVSRLAVYVKRARIGDPIVRRFPIHYRDARKWFEDVEHATLGHRIAMVRATLSKNLAKYGSESAGLSLEKYPFITKADLRSGKVSRHGRFSTWATSSGTSGEPVRFARSLRSIVYEQAAIDHVLGKFDVAPDARTVVLRGENVKRLDDWESPFSITASGGRRRIFSANHLSPLTIDHFAKEFVSHRPDVLFAYPSSLATFCELLADRGRELNVRVTVCSSEMLADGVRRLAEDVLNTHVISYYGQAERVAFAYADGGNGYRFLPGYSVVEFIPADEDGSWEIVGTTLWNGAMPLIRYRTGDLVRADLSDDLRDAILYGELEVDSIQGRSDDYLVTATGERLMGIDHIPHGIPALVRTQVVQRGDGSVVIRAVGSSHFSDRDVQTLLQNAARKIPPDLPVSVEIVDHLEPLPNGKVPFVIRESGFATPRGSSG